MKKACDDSEYGKTLDQVCSGHLSNMDKRTRYNCVACSPLNGIKLAEHCKQLVVKEEIAVYTICGILLILVLLALGLATLWRCKD